MAPHPDSAAAAVETLRAELEMVVGAFESIATLIGGEHDHDDRDAGGESLESAMLARLPVLVGYGPPGV